MSISQSAKAWNPEIECDVFRAAKSITLTAGTEEDAVWLARLSASIRRGRPVMELAMLVNALHFAEEAKP